MPPNEIRRRPIVGVMGSGSEPCLPRSADLGHWLAGRGFHLLTGGGRGVMTAVSRAFFETAGRQGQVIGILPCQGDGLCPPKPGYPNPWVEIAIRTHLPLSGEQGMEPSSRNHINVLSSDVVIALPGGPGTLSEVRLALRYEKPVIAFLESREELPGIPRQVPVARTLEDIEPWVAGLG